MNIHYAIFLDRLEQHEIEVVLNLSEIQQEQLDVTLPAWIPGSYMIRDFAKHITSINVESDGLVLAIEKLDKQTWRIQRNGMDTLQIRYRVYAWDLSVRSAHVDNTHAYFNGTSVFLRVIGHEDSQCNVILNRPNELDWKVSTTLPAIDIDAQGFGEYQAANYQSLIDYPVEIGTQYEFAFEAKGIPHRMALTESLAFDENRLRQDLERICAHHADMFGELPISQYLFLVLCVGDGYGGLEHCDSTSLMCNRTDLPQRNTQEVSKDYRQFLGLCSHEYFHLWNVKRIQPELFRTASLSNEVHSELLWAFEGITSYYDDLALVRSGCISEKEYLDTIATTVTRVMRSQGRSLQSVAESSFDTWTKFYKQDENAPNAIVSYYAKGALVAFGLDVLMRTTTNDRVCLDDLMRLLWHRHGKPGLGVPERGIEGYVSELIDGDVTAFFDDYVYGTKELPLAEWFVEIGVGYRLRAAKTLDDTGGYAENLSSDPKAVVLGARTTTQDNQIILSQVFADGAAQLAGLAPGDRLLAIDNEQITSGNLGKLLQRYAEGDVATIHYFRRQRLFETQIVHQLALKDTCDLYLLDDNQMSDQQQQRRTCWFNSNPAL